MSATFTRGPIFGWPRRELIDRDGSPYLVRWHLIDTERHGRLYLHRFWRSDEDVLHDHPWAFWSLILWGGYVEVTPCLPWGQWGLWHRTGSLLRRPATWRHRVVVPDRLRGRVWTLVWTGPKVREWGFWCPRGWISFHEHRARRAQTGEGCP